MADEFIIFTGTANSRLAVNVAREVGVQLGARAVERFPDGEISMRLDEPVRGREVFIVQPTSPPVNEHLVELLAFADACRFWGITENTREFRGSYNYSETIVEGLSAHDLRDIKPHTALPWAYINPPRIPLHKRTFPTAIRTKDGVRELAGWTSY